MAYWLFKEEPEHYSFADLQREGSTVWDGVSNNLARVHLRQVRRGDCILYYHTGKEKAIVGEMKAAADADPIRTTRTRSRWLSQSNRSARFAMWYPCPGSRRILRCASGSSCAFRGCRLCR